MKVPMRVIAQAEVQIVVDVEENTDHLFGWDYMRDEAIRLAEKERKNPQAWTIYSIAPQNNSLNSDWGVYQTRNSHQNTEV